MAPHSSSLAWKIPWTEEPGRLQSIGSWRVGHDWATSLSHALEKEMAAHSSVLAWRIPGPGEPGGLPSMGLHSRTKLKQLSSSSSTRLQSNAQNSPSQASTVCELRTFQCSSWILKRQRNQRSNSQHLLDHRKSKKNIFFCFIDYDKAFDCVDHNEL